MKRPFSIAFAVIAVLSILAKDLAAVSWQIWYVTNRAYVARELCVNTQKPEMQCNGKCHLAKQLQKVEDLSTGQAEPGKQKPVFPAGLKPRTQDWIAAGGAMTVVFVQFPAAEKEPVNWPGAAGRPMSFGNKVWRPPVTG